jgi:hypothetical protein
MDSQQAQELIEALRACTRALEANTAAVSSVAAGKQRAGAKPGAIKWESVRVKALAKEFPNSNGWFKAKLGATTSRVEEWMDTKSKSIADVLLDARENDLLVNITYDEKKNGQYTNRRLMTIEIVGMAGMPRESGQSDERADSRRTKKSDPQDDDEAPW